MLDDMDLRLYEHFHDMGLDLTKKMLRYISAFNHCCGSLLERAIGLGRLSLKGPSDISGKLPKALHSMKMCLTRTQKPTEILTKRCEFHKDLVC